MLAAVGATPPRPVAKARDEPGPVLVVFFTVVVVTAGTSGVALLVAPGATDEYFSWTLRAPAAAALIGGFYLASAAVFGWGLTVPRRQARALLVGVLGLAVPTLVLTLVHDEVFDFGRWQAIAWLVLFVTAPISASLLLLVGPKAPATSARVPQWCRLVLAVLAVLLGVLAVAIWADETRQELVAWSPVDLVRLTGTYLGAWCSFLAVLCAHGAATGRWDEVRVACVALLAAAVGAGLALLRSIGDIRHPAAALVACAVVAVLALGVYAAATGRKPRAAGATPR
ncbi:MAG: hypothetical protein M3179_01360 [Actinomycetota bacterium]|nr:hypothetical protein [Actinomycetota bacterium]